MTLALPDGNCLFRAVADQMYGDQSFHDIVRDACMNWMVFFFFSFSSFFFFFFSLLSFSFPFYCCSCCFLSFLFSYFFFLQSRERQHYTEFITGDFERYIAHRRQDRVYGSHLEIQAVSELYGRKVEVYDVDEFVSNPRARPRNVFQGEYRGHPIRLSYHNGNHYNSITDPDDPHIGEGLLPGFKSREEIERDLIQRVKESTDRDAIEDEISRVAEKQSLMAEEERIAREIEEREIQELIQRTRGQAGGGGGGGGGAVGGFGFGYGDYGYGDYDFGDGGIAVTTEDESERAMLEDAIIQSLRER